MPVKRTSVSTKSVDQKEYRCDYADCGMVFVRRFDFQRHQRSHCEYEERQFACPFLGCGFRANQKGGLKCHINSRHERVKLPCDTLGCTKTFSDPSSRRKHLLKFHNLTTKGSNRDARGRAQSCERERPIVPVQVARHDSRQYTEEVVNHQFAIIKFQASSSSVPLTSSSDNAVTRPALYGASSAPSSSVYQSTYTIRSHKEQAGVHHSANDVQTHRLSLDNNTKKEHQAYDANPGATLMVREYPPQPRVPTQASHSGATADLSQLETVRDQCHCWDCVGDSLTLAPMRRQHQDDQDQREGPIPPNPFSHPRTGHVHSSDHQRSLPPNVPSSAYLRPNPRMLFG